MVKCDIIDVLDRDGGGDFDHDGISDAEEYTLGTDPGRLTR